MIRLRDVVARSITTARSAVARDERLEAAAQVLHGARHPLGMAGVCGGCRDLTRRILAAATL